MHNVTEHKIIMGTHHTDVTKQKIRKSTKKNQLSLWSLLKDYILKF